METLTKPETVKVPRLFVLAGSSHEAVSAARDLGLHPKRWMFLAGPNSVRGCRGASVFALRHWERSWSTERIRELESWMVVNRMVWVEADELDPWKVGG